MHRKVLMKKLVTLFCYAFAFPYFSYCNQVWDNTYNTSSKDKLVRLQNRIVQIISNGQPDSNNNGIYHNNHHNLNIFKLHQTNTLLTAKYIFINITILLPDQFSGMFTANNATYHYYTRQGNKLRTPKHNTNIVKCTIRPKGPIVWNKISIDV